MNLTKFIGVGLTGLFLVASNGIVWNGSSTYAKQETTEKTIKKVPIVHSKPDSGSQMWKDYCAVCHGMNGTGNGPAAEYLKTPPPDLSLMAKHNNGKFPSDRFGTVLRLGTESHAHGTTDMPIWGTLFRSVNKDLTELRIHNLSEFVESFQQK